MRKPEIRIFGIRHHGAGSARRLRNALLAYEPESILIELPADSNTLIEELKQTDHTPPVAFLYYDRDQPHKSLYLPMALFSPEYQAILYAFENNISLQCMDIPAAAFLHSTLYNSKVRTGPEKKYQHIINDPIGYLASQAGYEDAERWWESHFEQWHEHEKLFSLIQDLMSELRRQSEGLDDQETLLREQYMRCRIRECARDHPVRIAVICGAWHGPVLTPEFLEATELEPEPDLKLTNVSTCLIPWSYKHLSLNQQYTAGIKAPQWHESMFHDTQKAAASFLSKAAQVLRNEGISISPASIIDASFFADRLALVRELPGPGLEELMESATLHFGQGLKQNEEWFREKIFCGETTGHISFNRQTLPFVKLFHEQLKQLKLQQYWKESHKESILLDLRKDKHLLVSRFLHYCNLLDLPWASNVAVDWKTLGSFHEKWDFQWHPDLEMVLIQRGLLGNTLSQACTQYILNQLKKNRDILSLVRWLDHSLKADLSELWSHLSIALDNALLTDQDYIQLSLLVQPLSNIRDYGSLHKTDIQWIQVVLSKLLPKLILNLYENAKHIQDERARKMLGALLSIQNYFNSLPEDESAQDWYDQLKVLAESQDCNPLLRGKSWSHLLEKNKISEACFLEAFRFEFSLQTQIPSAALWLEGFIQSKSGIYLVHPSIVSVLDMWLKGLDPEHFKSNLPLLRRCFSQISPAERSRIFKLLHQPSQESSENLSWNLNENRRQLIEAMLQKLNIT